jgi:hypothetical protein
MPDTRIAALAETFRIVTVERKPKWQSETVQVLVAAGEFDQAAAAILAALPEGWCGHDPFHRKRCHNYDPDAVIAHLHTEYDKAAAEIARLRAIEEAARAVCEGVPDGLYRFDALRAALGEDR